LTWSIDTPRLRLRKYQEHDLASILAFSLEADALLRRNLDWEANEASIRDYWAQHAELDLDADPPWMSLVVEEKATGKAIGTVGLGVRGIAPHRQGVVGWALGCAHQGRGLATEAARALIDYAFLQLGLHRIYARTGADNVRSWKLMERLGMRREAHFVKSHAPTGEWRDEYIYAVLVDEWKQAKI
jgi:RimJ/RimL family protein N-acetyltransferase